VRRVLPGETVSVRADGTVRSRRYFSPEPLKEWSFRSYEECQEAFQDVFEAAVRCRLNSTTNPSLLMSGGMDSASVAAAWHKLSAEGRRDEISVLSLVSDDFSECIESQCIYDLIDRLALNPSLVQAPSLSGCAGAEDLDAAFFDRPHPVSHSILMNGLLSRVAQRSSRRVLLHGSSGDLAMHVPDDYLLWFFRRGNWQQGIRECIGAGQNHTYFKGTSVSRLLAQSAWRHLAMPGAKGLVNRLRGKRAGSLFQDSLVNRALAKRIDLESRLDAALLADGSTRKGIQLNHLEVLYPAGVMVGLEGYDRVAGNHGIEMRDPWADTRVLEFFARLPLRFKVRQGWLKPLVRDVYGELLGEQVVMRKDKGHVGWRAYKRFTERHNRYMKKKLRDASEPIEQYVDALALRQALDRHETTRLLDDALTCYKSLSLALWLEQLKEKAKN
jgi:asparagine synthase (glutamine-hydrolysing)